MIRRSIATCLLCSFCYSTSAQQLDAQRRAPHDVTPQSAIRHTPIEPESVNLTVPKGTALQVALDSEVRVRTIGQPIRGHTTAAVYAFDKLVIPAGMKVTGRISKIEDVSIRQRTFAALDANLSPRRDVQVGFTNVSLANGELLPIETNVVKGSGGVLQFVTTAGTLKKQSAKQKVQQREKQVAEQVRQQIDHAVAEVKQPGRFHRLERAAVAQLPWHPQYLEAGTTYFAELQQPLNFGFEPFTPAMAVGISTPIPPGSVVRATLMTPLNSGTTQNGAEVQAVVSQPMLVDDKLVLPQGTLLKGSVVQVRASRHWKRNGQLRFVFRDLTLPNGVESKIDGILNGVQSEAAAKLSLDSEGGSVPQTPKARYLRTAISVGLAAATHEDETLNRAEGGAGGFKVVGIIVGAAVQSHPLAISMGALGASRSIYNNFIARGRDVDFPKHTAMQVEVGAREARDVR